MESKNGYFKLDIREGNVFLLVYPPEEGGKPLEYKEVTAYLEKKGYGMFDLKVLNQALNSTEGVQEVCVGIWNGLYENEHTLLPVFACSAGFSSSPSIFSR